MKHIVLISCVSMKQEYPSPARSLYISPLFLKNLKYAESLRPDHIFILSAKYGLLKLEEEIEPYDQTLNQMRSAEIKAWADRVLAQLGQRADLHQDTFTFLAGENYRKFLVPHLKNYQIPMQGLGIGKQLQWLKNRLTMSKNCDTIHQWFNQMEKHSFPFDQEKIPENGIYILFEKGELAHDTNRIVRIGTHTGENQLRSRLKQHFLQANKDRSIFRKNIGRAFLNQGQDPFLQQWEIDLTTRAAKAQHANAIDFAKQKAIENKVSDYIQHNFYFVVFRVDKQAKRLYFESRIISTVSLCNVCKPSESWLGNSSPKKKIRESGLWQVNELWKEPLSESDLDELKHILGREK